MPVFRSFSPDDVIAEESVRMTVDEFEALRLLDGEGLTQEACAGRAYYGCDRAAVLCPGAFTRAARELAEATDVDLWDAHTLSRMMKKSGRVPRPGRR